MAANASISQPKMNNKPPMGVIGPIATSQFQPSRSRHDNRYRDPENNTIPKVKR
jgi:hypothetical protein